MVGVVAGNFYWNSNRSQTEFLIATLTRRPVGDAAHLAFRFGSREQARGLFEELRRTPSEPGIAAGNEMFIQIHLAALSGEPEADGSDSPHLRSAIDACKRYRASNCELSRMKESAASLSRLRRE